MDGEPFCFERSTEMVAKTHVSSPSVAVGMPYKQMGRGERLWYSMFPVRFNAKKIESAVNSHIIINGLSGTGKTELAIKLLEMAKAEGWAPFVEDRHYGLYAKACEIYPDAVCIDTPHGTYPHLNPLKGDIQVVDGIVAAAKSLWPEGLKDRASDLLYHVFKALWEAELPITSAVPFMTDKSIRDEILKRCTSDTRHYWLYIGRQREAQTWLEACRNKLSCIDNPLIRPIFEETEPTIDLYQCFEEGRAVLVNASSNYFKDGSSATLLCALLLHLAYDALVRREAQREKRQVMLVCDEAPSYYVDSIFDPVITQLRKFGASIVVMGQHLSQYPVSSVATLMTCGHTVSFACNNADAKRLADEMLPPQFEAWRRSDGKYLHPADVRNLLIGDLMSLPRQQVMWKIRTVDGGELYMAKVSDTMK
jgi:hypothetical protein